MARWTFVLSARSTKPAITSPVTVSPLVKVKIRFVTIVRRPITSASTACWAGVPAG